MNFNHPVRPEKSRRDLINQVPTVQLSWKVLLIALALSACTETMDIDFPEEPPQLVVYSLFHPDSVWQVSVSSTKDLNSPNTPYQVVDDATVEIYQNGRLLDELAFRGYLEPTRVMDNVRDTTYDSVIWRRADEYRSERGIRPEMGVTYTLRVSAPGYPTATATGRVPEAPAVTLKEVRYNLNEGLWPHDQSIDIGGVMRDPPEQNNFYLTGASFQDPKRKDRADGGYDTVYVRAYLPASPLEIRTLRISDFYLFSDQSFFGIAYPLQFRVGFSHWIEQEGINAITLHLGAVEEPFYRYYETLEAQESYRIGIVNLTDPPQAYSNVANGLGVFAGYNTIDLTIYREDWE